ncbi:MAG: MaoC family dehydratase N-terminal domain-containing protein [Rhizobacter sp.]|nr:MaoC family dehydratase N-terminal domain-containing protein [Rhizobacter sp.]
MSGALRIEDWIDRETVATDRVHAAPVRALAATLDRDDPEPREGDALAPLWHWLFFLPHDRQSALGEDGHARRGGFLPPIALPRRMWAGGRFEFIRPLHIGEAVTRTSRIADIQTKTGRSGPLAFVRVEHAIAGAEGVALREEHDIVYRAAPTSKPNPTPAADPSLAPTDEHFARAITPDPVLLFRYSALTFNGHRIHYDRSYVREVEGYPGLVVHGPLIATLLVDLLRRERPGAQLARFSFRALQPLFDTAPFALCGRDADSANLSLWARDAKGCLAMQADAVLVA